MARPSRHGPCPTTIPQPMADAARPAHSGGFPLAAVFSLGLAVMPLRVHAGVIAAPTAEGPAEPEGTSEPGAAPEGGAPDEAGTEDDAGGNEADAAEPSGEEADADDAAEPSGEEAGADDAAEPGDDAATDDAKTTDQGAATPGALGPTAAPLRPMQTAAWWTMFGAFAVGTTAGVLAGLAERQEDRATRLSTLFDAETGAQPRYTERKDEYERYLRRGEGFSKAAIGVGVVAGAATIAAITLFAIDAARQRGDAAPKQKRRTSLRVGGGGLEVRF